MANMILLKEGTATILCARLRIIQVVFLALNEGGAWLRGIQALAPASRAHRSPGPVSNRMQDITLQTIIV